MKTLSSPLTTAIAASGQGWIELYDFYLKSAISTPWGTISIIRVCNYSGDFAFFAPQSSPEPTATQSSAQTYRQWPLKRELAKSSNQFANDKLKITASNVTQDWATMLSAVDWYDTPVVIRKVSDSITTPTAADCAVIFSGLVDSAIVTTDNLQFTCSNDLGTFDTILPRQNMHRTCRFRFADDMCTQLKWSTENYRGGCTVAAGSTTTQINSPSITDDESASSAYGTDLVNPLAAAAITTSSEQGSTSASVTPDFHYHIFNCANHGLSIGDAIQFTAAVFPMGISGMTTYYAFPTSPNAFGVTTVPGNNLTLVNFTSNGSTVSFATVVSNFHGSNVRSSIGSYWKMGVSTDWGNLVQGYWTIPTLQAGLQNAALTPWIQFDFGVARKCTLWQVSTPLNLSIENLVRMIEIFSSPDASTWKFETYFEIPPTGAVLYDVLIPKATSNRYWRICIRSRWSESLFYTLLATCKAYESCGRNWWLGGQVTFDAATATVALRNISRRVLASYNQILVTELLPAIPSTSDTFSIKRGCPRTFNACAARLNTENFGGFLDLPFQQILR